VRFLCFESIFTDRQIWRGFWHLPSEAESLMDAGS
jgi:hypothetical protein